MLTTLCSVQIYQFESGRSPMSLSDHWSGSFRSSTWQFHLQNYITWESFWFIWMIALLTFRCYDIIIQCRQIMCPHTSEKYGIVYELGMCQIPNGYLCYQWVPASRVLYGPKCLGPARCSFSDSDCVRVTENLRNNLASINSYSLQRINCWLIQQ